ALYRSGQLRRMIEKLSGPQEGAGAATGGGVGAGAGGGAGVAPITLPVEVPLINSVAAGYPTEFTDLGYPARVADQYVRTPDICDPDAFAARVVGDSMEPDYREGDIVVFSPARTVASGMDCFVRLEPDHATTFKRVFFESDERRVMSGEKAEAKAVTHIRLQPLNPKYPAKVLEREQVAGVYAAVSVTRSVG
ncbi:MAG: S24 family peptidase, partial [Phycisphaerales bacterium]